MSNEEDLAVGMPHDSSSQDIADVNVQADMQPSPATLAGTERNHEVTNLAPSSAGRLAADANTDAAVHDDHEARKIRVQYLMKELLLSIDRIGKIKLGQIESILMRAGEDVTACAGLSSKAPTRPPLSYDSDADTKFPPFVMEEPSTRNAADPPPLPPPLPPPITGLEKAQSIKWTVTPMEVNELNPPAPFNYSMVEAGIETGEKMRTLAGNEDQHGNGLDGGTRLNPPPDEIKPGSTPLTGLEGTQSTNWTLPPMEVNELNPPAPFNYSMVEAGIETGEKMCTLAASEGQHDNGLDGRTRLNPPPDEIKTGSETFLNSSAPANIRNEDEDPPQANPARLVSFSSAVPNRHTRRTRRTFTSLLKIPHAYLGETRHDEERDTDALEEVVEGVEVTWWDQQKWKIVSSVVCFLFVLVAVVPTAVYLSLMAEDEEQVAPTDQPSFPPSYDSRPTLEIIQDRSYLRCGIEGSIIQSGARFHEDLCRSMAAVMLGHPESIAVIPVTWVTRWRNLLDRDVDLLLSSDTYTIEREVMESSTGAGFDFSSPYMYDGMAFFGQPIYVECAEEFRRYNECKSLRVCATMGTTIEKFLKSTFPSDVISIATSREDMMNMLSNNTCNVVLDLKFYSMLFDKNTSQSNFTWGKKFMTKEPGAAVTRKDDPEFSRVVNWVVNSLFYGEEEGLVKDPSRCLNYTILTGRASDLDFSKALYCVGNYDEIYHGDPNNRGMNRINNGTGMLYGIPFGNLEPVIDDIAEGSLANVRKMGSLVCGVLVPENFDGEVTDSNSEVGMGVEFCHTLAAALFRGGYNDVSFLAFHGTDDSAYLALKNHTVDVLVGIGSKADKKYAVDISTPYYWADDVASNGTRSFSLATPDTDHMFSSFVNSVVVATIYALEHRIDRERMLDMPLVTLFGRDLTFALRDAVSYLGNYDQIYVKNFNSTVSESNRGRNRLNEGGPLFLPLPGIDHHQT